MDIYISSTVGELLIDTMALVMGLIDLDKGYSCWFRKVCTTKRAPNSLYIQHSPLLYQVTLRQTRDTQITKDIVDCRTAEHSSRPSCIYDSTNFRPHASLWETVHAQPYTLREPAVNEQEYISKQPTTRAATPDLNQQQSKPGR